MPVTAVIRREFEIYGLDSEGDGCLFPRDVSQATFAQLTEYRSKTVFNEAYDAFPYAIKLGNSIVGIFSTGAAHAKSDKQVMFRSDDNGQTFMLRDFFINDTLQTDASLISDLLSQGESVTLKVWNLRKNNGAIDVITHGVITGNGKDYNIWGRPVASGANLLRTAYSATGNWEAAVLESTDRGATWAFKSVIAPGTAGRQYNEADIVNTTGSTWIAYIREDLGASDNLYKSTSTDDGATWSAPELVDPKIMNGRQPNLQRLSDGSITLATGDRSGTSGYAGGAGDIINGVDTTGATIWRSTDNGATWSFRTRVAPIYSTDGGQPFVLPLGGANAFIVWYARKTAKGNPAIVSCTMNLDGI